MKPLTALAVDTFLQVSEQADIPLKSLLELVQKMEDGASAAFLSRYRADLCAGLDEAQVLSLLGKLRDCQDLADRRISMVATLTRRGEITPELKAQLEGARSRQELNDIFAPYRQRTNPAADPVEAATRKGLDPLARTLWYQEPGVDIEEAAGKHIDSDGEVSASGQALEGAYLIAARWLSEKPEIVRDLRKLFQTDCEFSVKVEPSALKDPRWSGFDGFQAKAAEVPWRKRLQIRRGERMGTLSSTVELPLESASKHLERCLIKDPESPYAPHLKKVVSAAIRNGLSDRVKRDVLTEIEEAADSQAIAAFQKTLREQLLGPTAHGLSIVGIETRGPGGWRAALVDGEGRLVDHALVGDGKGTPKPADADTAAPSSKERAAGPEAGGPPDKEAAPDAAKPPRDGGSNPVPARPVPKARQVELCDFLRDRDVGLIVYTAGPKRHESERFIRSHIRRSGNPRIPWRAVRDGSTWIYARSKRAKQELPRLEPAFRSAVTLARRVQDPMAELVKVDPVVTGAGPYHRDLGMARLRRMLRRTLECVVHEVGVDVNRASSDLLSLVPGFNRGLARRVEAYRRRNGPFGSREELRKVEGLSDQIFAQSVGFLRVYGAHPLDATGAHPQYRELQEQIAEAAGCDLSTLLSEPERLDGLDLEQFASKERSVLLVKAAIDELRPERRRLRKQLRLPEPVVPLRSDEELKPGSKISGVVAGIVDYGVWVDVGADRDALLHISQIKQPFLQDSKPALKPGADVEVYVRPPIEGRDGPIGLTMWEPRSRPPANRSRFGGPGQRRGFSGSRGPGRRFGRPGRGKPLRRTFGPSSAGKRGPRRKLTLSEKLDMLQDKYRTKI